MQGGAGGLGASEEEEAAVMGAQEVAHGGGRRGFGEVSGGGYRSYRPKTQRVRSHTAKEAG